MAEFHQISLIDRLKDRTEYKKVKSCDTCQFDIYAHINVGKNNAENGLILQNWKLLHFYTFKKKVLLRERKRHTVRHVASARSTALSPDGNNLIQSPQRGWGLAPSIPNRAGVPPSSPKVVPKPVQMGVTPIQSWWRIPPSSPNGWVPHPVLMGGTQGTPSARWGTLPLLARWGTPSSGWGYPRRLDAPPPHRWCEQTENITFPHPSNAGGKYLTFLVPVMQFVFLLYPEQPVFVPEPRIWIWPKTSLRRHQTEWKTQLIAPILCLIENIICLKIWFNWKNYLLKRIALCFGEKKNIQWNKHSFCELPRKKRFSFNNDWNTTIILCNVISSLKSLCLKGLPEMMINKLNIFMFLCELNPSFKSTL